MAIFQQYSYCNCNERRKLLKLEKSLFPTYVRVTTIGRLGMGIFVEGPFYLIFILSVMFYCVQLLLGFGVLILLLLLMFVYCCCCCCCCCIFVSGPTAEVNGAAAASAPSLSFGFKSIPNWKAFEATLFPSFRWSSIQEKKNERKKRKKKCKRETTSCAVCLLVILI